MLKHNYLEQIAEVPENAQLQKSTDLKPRLEENPTQLPAKELEEPANQGKPEDSALSDLDKLSLLKANIFKWQQE